MDQDETWHRGISLDTGHCVRWDTAPLPQKGQPPILGPCLLWPNGWMEQDATWHGGRPRPWPHCVRWGPSPPAPKGAEPPNFRPTSAAPNSPTPPKRGGGTAGPTFSPIYCGQTAGWIKMPLGMEVGLGPGHIVLHGASSPPKGTPPIFGPCLLWPNGWMDQGSICHLAER